MTGCITACYHRHNVLTDNMTTISRIFLWRVIYRVKTDKINMFKYLMQSVYWKWILISWYYWQASYPSIRQVFDVAKEMSSAFHKARFAQFSCVCCFAGFLCYFPVNLLECYHDTYWKDIHRNWCGRWVIFCCSTVRFHFLDGLFSLHFRNMFKKK
jgi:hypothetical protein